MFLNQVKKKTSVDDSWQSGRAAAAAAARAGVSREVLSLAADGAAQRREHDRDQVPVPGQLAEQLRAGRDGQPRHHGEARAPSCMCQQIA